MSDVLWNEVAQQEYSNKLMLQAQQSGKLLAAITDGGRIQAKEKFFYQQMALSGTVNRGRLQDVSEYWEQATFEARRIKDYVLSLPVPFDNIDLARTVLDPKSTTAETIKMAMGRLYDQLVWNAILGTTLGKDDSTTYSLGTANTVGVQVGGSSSNIGMKFAKLVAAQEVLMNNNVDPFTTPTTLILTPKAWGELVQEEMVSSKDYGAASVAVNGKLQSIVGIAAHIITPSVPYVDSSNDPYMTIKESWSKVGIAQDGADATDIRCCALVAKSAVQYGTWRDPMMTLDRIPMRSNAQLFQWEQQCGAARTTDEGVVKILVDESP